MVVTLEEYTLELGKLVVNLHSLEFALRAFLWNREGGSSWRFLDTLKEGDNVPENAFTNYDSLDRLVQKYNGFIGLLFPELALDASVVRLRDAIAHGRLAANVPQPPLRLLKFGKPQRGTVAVTHCVLVDEVWLSVQRTAVRRDLEKVAEGDRRLSATGGKKTG